MQRPFISVAIPTYNSENFITKTLERRYTHRHTMPQTPKAFNPIFARYLGLNKILEAIAHSNVQ